MYDQKTGQLKNVAPLGKSSAPGENNLVSKSTNAAPTTTLFSSGKAAVTQSQAESGIDGSRFASSLVNDSNTTIGKWGGAASVIDISSGKKKAYTATVPLCGMSGSLYAPAATDQSQSEKHAVSTHGLSKKPGSSRMSNTSPLSAQSASFPPTVVANAYDAPLGSHASDILPIAAASAPASSPHTKDTEGTDHSYRTQGIEHLARIARENRMRRENAMAVPYVSLPLLTSRWANSSLVDEHKDKLQKLQEEQVQEKKTDTVNLSDEL